MTTRFGDALVLKACRDGELISITHLAVAVDYRIRDRDQRIKDGLSKGVTADDEITDSVAGHFIYRLVRACGEHGHPPPPELIRLVQTFTKQDRPPRGTGPRRRKKNDWLAAAKRYWDRNPHVRPADVARFAKVERSTVSKAIQKGRLEAPGVADKESP